MQKATLAAGCFWCTEAVFQRLKGVISVVPGYSGGQVVDPTYDEVCEGKTGHAEAIQITYDPKVISFEELLYVFWRLHDPTTLNKQEADEGTQYRSVIFYHSDIQKEVALRSKKEVEESGLYKSPIVTEIVPFTEFYEAEPYHKNFYQRNLEAAYCRYVIDPKIQKLRKDFQEMVEEEVSS